MNNHCAIRLLSLFSIEHSWWKCIIETFYCIIVIHLIIGPYLRMEDHRAAENETAWKSTPLSCIVNMTMVLCCGGWKCLYEPNWRVRNGRVSVVPWCIRQEGIAVTGQRSACRGHASPRQWHGLSIDSLHALAHLMPQLNTAHIPLFENTDRSMIIFQTIVHLPLSWQEPVECESPFFLNSLMGRTINATR